MENQIKVFVLDTSVLIHDPGVIEQLGNNTIVIPIEAIEELDKAKGAYGVVGASSRDASRKLDSYRERGSLKNGVVTDAGGKLYVDYNGMNWEDLPVGLNRSNDNRIILVAMAWQRKAANQEVIVLSKDTNLRVKADACGLAADDYRHDKRISRIEDLYTGRIDLSLDASEAGILTALSANKSLPVSQFAGISGFNLGVFPANVCLRFICGDKYTLGVYRQATILKDSVIEHVAKPKPAENQSGGKIVPVNDEQALALHLLLRSDIGLVTLVGKAGTGKTLMALLAAYKQLDHRKGSKIQKILVWRPNVEIGKSLGFLPGDIGEKFAPWAEPIYENLRLIIGPDQKKDGVVYNMVDEVLGHQLEIKPINYALGGTKHQTIIIIDEAQNLTPREIAALITRCGKDSKVVVTGDPYQIYNPYLSPASNGLTDVVERFKGYPLFGHITMTKSERSELAELAADIL